MAGARLFEPGQTRQRIDRYELVGEIASGGMATVFLARLGGVGGFQRFVAIKRLHPHLQGEKEFVEMFLDEARLSAGIHHPNVVSILEVGASPVGYYLVMEYVEGDTLARLLARSAGRGKRIPAPIALRMVLDTLHGLHAAHELKDDQGVSVDLVHRDVSPQNVLVGVDGIARITDFGVARASSRLTSTRAGQLKGKLAYMAPEQVQGEKLDRRADVFSAGILIWETLAAKRLFKADNEAATLQRVVNEVIPDLQRIAPHLSPELCAVVAKALDRDRDRRFPTALAFADALEEAALAHETIADKREVAQFVKETLGQEIEQQREAVRAWLARSEPSQVAPPQPKAPTSVSVAAMSIPDGSSSTFGGAPAGGSKPRRSTSSLVLAGLAVALLAGGGGYLMAHRRAEPAPLVTAPAAPPPPEPADKPTAQPAAQPLPSVAPSVAEPPAASETASAQASAAPSAADAPAPVHKAAAPAPRPAPQRRPSRAKSAADDLLNVNPYR